MEDEQRVRLEVFLAQKKQLWELKSEKISKKIAELGAGNGRVVHCVRLKATQAIIAKKMIHLVVKLAIKIQIIIEPWIHDECNSLYIVRFFGHFIAMGK